MTEKFPEITPELQAQIDSVNAPLKTKPNRWGAVDRGVSARQPWGVKLSGFLTLVVSVSIVTAVAVLANVNQGGVTMTGYFDLLKWVGGAFFGATALQRIGQIGKGGPE